MSTADPVIVARFHYRHEAELAYGFLQNAGIEAGLFIDDAGGMEVGLAFSNPARLVVRGDEVDEARRVLTDAGILESADD